MAPHPPEYAPVPTASCDDGDELQPPPRQPFCISWHILTLLLGILVGAGATAAVLATAHENSAHSELSASRAAGFEIDPATGSARCGRSWQEAKQLGCRFDVMASRWYPEECFNGALMEQMLEEVDFDWFADPRHTTPATRELALSGEFDALWPLPDFHIMHCLYLWRLLHSAVVGHRHLDDDVYDYNHTLHCTRMIMAWPRGKTTTTIARSGIPYCRAKAL